MRTALPSEAVRKSNLLGWTAVLLLVSSAGCGGGGGNDDTDDDAAPDDTDTDDAEDTDDSDADDTDDTGQDDSEETTYEDTTRSGTIDSDERWRGTIDVTGDVTIETGATLTIEPGTTVRFAAGSDDQAGGITTPFTDPPFPNDPAIAPSEFSSLDTYGGTLSAVGTAEEPILFTSAASDPEWSDWQSIQFNAAGSHLILQNTVIEYGYFGVQINAAATADEVTLEDNTIRHIVACGICGSPTETVTVTISGNDISDCGHEGIATFPPSTFTIENNTFHDIRNSYGDDLTSPVAVIIEGNGSTVRNNQFSDNDVAIGIITEDATPTIEGNTFEDNGEDCGGFCPDPLQ